MLDKWYGGSLLLTTNGMEVDCVTHHKWYGSSLCYHKWYGGSLLLTTNGMEVVCATLHKWHRGRDLAKVKCMIKEKSRNYTNEVKA